MIAKDSIVGGIFTKNIGKLLYFIRKNEEFNRFACPILMVLCSLLRNYEERIQYTDQTTIDLISTLIRKVICHQKFIKEIDPVYEQFEELENNFFELDDHNLQNQG